MKEGQVLLEELYAIFPNSLYNPTPDPASDQYFLVTENQARLFIPLQDLSSENKSLLNLLILKQESGNPNQADQSPRSPWKFILKGEQSVPELSITSIRLLHLHLKQQDSNFDSRMWRETLISTTPAIIEILEWQANYFIVILDHKKLLPEMLDQIEGILTALDDDFSLKTSTLIGQPFNPHNRLPLYFDTEQEIYEWAVREDFLSQWTFLSEALLKQIAYSALKKLPTLRYYKQLISGQDDIDLIKTLFKNNGNLSQTADALFIHRNTLTYRLNKFSKKTGLNLSHLSDLLLAYLLIVSGK